MSGGPGDDYLYASESGRAVIHGDAGNDDVDWSDYGSADLYGDDGNDDFELQSFTADTRVFGGDGNDFAFVDDLVGGMLGRRRRRQPHPQGRRPGADDRAARRRTRR